jgi:hypothetical protein
LQTHNPSARARHYSHPRGLLRLRKRIQKTNDRSNPRVQTTAPFESNHKHRVASISKLQALPGQRILVEIHSFENDARFCVRNVADLRVEAHQQYPPNRCSRSPLHAIKLIRAILYAQAEGQQHQARFAAALTFGYGDKSSYTLMAAAVRSDSLKMLWVPDGRFGLKGHRCLQ